MKRIPPFTVSKMPENMLIYKYNEGEHGGGFIGLHVAVLVNKELKQKEYQGVSQLDFSASHSAFVVNIDLISIHKR